KSHQCHTQLTRRVDRANSSLLHATQGERAGGSCCCSASRPSSDPPIKRLSPPATLSGELLGPDDHGTMMSRPGTEASKQAAVGVPHSAPAPAPVAVISTRRITYLKKVPIRRSNQFNILAWWEMSSGEYPKLSHMARDILAVPASTVASESAFSIGSGFYHIFEVG
ncbi:unnamed protein product, partial [Urochloa humidicola]